MGRFKSNYANTVQGKREDIRNIFFRSRWEANVARFLDILVLCGKIVEWKYEPQVFTFPVKRGNMTYTPDFQVFNEDGSYYWIEVKGYMDNDSKVKLKRFAKYYPDEQLVLLTGKEYRPLEKQFKDIIPHWETSAKK